MYRLRSVVLGVVIVSLSLSAWGGSEYGGYGFEVRLPSAFMRFTEVSALGGETVANRYSSAVNPASAGWVELRGKYGVVLAPYYSNITFGEGTVIQIFGESVTWDSGEWGIFQPTLSQIRSNKESMSNGLDFDYEVDTFQLQWGKRFDDWGIGATFNVAWADVITDGSPVVGVHVHSKGEAESYRFRFGGLWEFEEKWLGGLIFEYGFAPFESELTTTVAMPFPLPPMVTVVRDSGTQHQFMLRPGISYEYDLLCSVFLDYQVGMFDSPDDYLCSHRVSAGVDHRMLEWLVGRVCGAVDGRGNLSCTAGVSAFLGENVTCHLGYQYDSLPELRPEFGRSHTFQATVSLSF